LQRNIYDTHATLIESPEFDTICWNTGAKGGPPTQRLQAQNPTKFSRQHTFALVCICQQCPRRRVFANWQLLRAVAQSSFALRRAGGKKRRRPPPAQMGYDMKGRRRAASPQTEIPCNILSACCLRTLALRRNVRRRSVTRAGKRGAKRPRSNRPNRPVRVLGGCCMHHL
jgi:hypothetical protein